MTSPLSAFIRAIRGKILPFAAASAFAFLCVHSRYKTSQQPRQHAILRQRESGPHGGE